MPSFRDRIPVVLDRVITLCGTGELIDVIATERGFAINPRREDILSTAKKCRVPIRTIDDTADEVNRLTEGSASMPVLRDKVVAATKWVGR